MRWIVAAFMLLSFSSAQAAIPVAPLFDAEIVSSAKVIPIPRPKPPEASFAQAQTDPKFLFPDRTQPAPVTVQPAPTPVPVTTDTSIPTWTNTGLLGVLAALMGKIAFFPKHGTAGVAKPSTTPGELLHPPGGSLIGDPNIRATIDATALRLVESGAPGEAIKMAFSFVPGAGPIVTMLEPAFRAISVKFLQDRAGVVVGAAGAPMTIAPLDHSIVQDETAKRLSGIEEILQMLSNRIANKANS